MKTNNICERLSAGEDLKSILESSEPQKIHLIISDPDDQILPLLKTIQDYSTSGHSFTIVVDPNDSERKQEFWIDGDGAAKLRVEEVITKEETKDE